MGTEGESSKREGLEQYSEDEKVEQEISFYHKINILENNLDSECPNFELFRTEKGLVARCKIMDRVLTSSQAELCSKVWKSCPIRVLT
ncbi:hypothetical protein KN1_24770 [Stygiolobus caldivivus]|uniref:Uncharacterized protein n=2 Tax=Stygiolobus caldivivus TaxID=2824673 RepID=A0A8D5U8U9_9CREN|nr:hypothetical protein KN1_24770 [Stygiolobus caldivivus]